MPMWFLAKIKKVKVILAGKLQGAVTIQGIQLQKGLVKQLKQLVVRSSNACKSRAGGNK